MTAPEGLEAGAVLVALPYPSSRRPDQNPFLHAFARSLLDHGVPVEVIAPQRLPATGISERREVRDGIVVNRPIHWSPGVGPPARAARLRLAHRGFEAAVRRAAANVAPPAFYWGHFLRPSGASAVELRRRHGRPAFIVLGEGDRLAASIDRFGLAANGEVLRAATGIVAVSEALATKAIAEHGLEPEHVAVFPNSVDIDRFSPGDRAAARRALGVDGRTFVTVFVGRLDDRKGADRVAAALDLVGGDVVGLFLGHGRAPRPARPGDVVGRVGHEAVADHLRAADVFVLPSLAEGNPNAVTEAMACGLPAVVSDRPFMHEVADEETACFVDPEDPAAIADALRALRDDPDRRIRMGAAARRRAVQVPLATRTANILEWVAPRVRAFRP